MAFSVPISTLERKENHYSKREVDELDEQKVDGSTVHFPARAPQKFRAYLLWLTRESRGGSLALGRDGRGGLGEGPRERSRVAVGRGPGSAA